jgi:molybdopterin converting factor small subunit
MKFVVAVDKQIVHGDTELHDNTTVALLPPYAGG